jgi:hypothetical protein
MFSTVRFSVTLAPTAAQFAPFSLKTSFCGSMERIFKAAKANGYEVFISPHYFYPADTGWKFNGPLETDEFRTHSFARGGPLNLTGFSNSGADWLERFKPYIEDGKTIVVSPHKVWVRRPTI